MEKLPIDTIYIIWKSKRCKLIKNYKYVWVYYDIKNENLKENVVNNDHEKKLLVLQHI